MAGLILKILLCCSLFIALCNGLKVSEYEADWSMDYSLINNWVRAKTTLSLKWYALVEAIKQV